MLGERRRPRSGFVARRIVDDEDAAHLWLCERRQDGALDRAGAFERRHDDVDDADLRRRLHRLYAV